MHQGRSSLSPRNGVHCGLSSRLENTNDPPAPETDSIRTPRRRGNDASLLRHAAAGRVGLYHMSSNYAARFCRRVGAQLARRRCGVTRDLMAELRRFYRWGNVRKLRHIERYA